MAIVAGNDSLPIGTRKPMTHAVITNASARFSVWRCARTFWYRKTFPALCVIGLKLEYKFGSEILQRRIA